MTDASESFLAQMEIIGGISLDDATASSGVSVAKGYAGHLGVMPVPGNGRYLYQRWKNDVTSQTELLFPDNTITRMEIIVAQKSGVSSTPNGLAAFVVVGAATAAAATAILGGTAAAGDITSVFDDIGEEAGFLYLPITSGGTSIELFFGQPIPFGRVSIKSNTSTNGNLAVWAGAQ